MYQQLNVSERWFPSQGDQVTGNFRAGPEKLCVAWKPVIIFQNIKYVIF